MFERQHLLDVWEDGKIRVSVGWNDEITDAMASAGLVVFLLTPEVLESEYILKTELPFLQNRWQQERIQIFPVVCEPRRWKEQEESRWLHAVQSPAGAEPLAGFSEPVAERHLRTLATTFAEELSRVALAELAYPSLPIADMFLAHALGSFGDLTSNPNWSAPAPGEQPQEPAIG